MQLLHRDGAPARAPRPSQVAAARRGTLLAGLVCAAGSWATYGASGLVSAALGALVVVAFFSTGLLPLLLAGSAAPRAGMALALLLLTYTLRLALVLLGLRLAERAEFLHAPSLGTTIIGCAVVWCALHVVAVIRASRT